MFNLHIRSRRATVGPVILKYTIPRQTRVYRITCLPGKNAFLQVAVLRASLRRRTKCGTAGEELAHTLGSAGPPSERD